MLVLDPDLPPAVEPPVPSVLDVPLLPVPAALPPVPSVVLVEPPPALLRKIANRMPPPLVSFAPSASGPHPVNAPAAGIAPVGGCLSRRRFPATLRRSAPT